MSRTVDSKLTVPDVRTIITVLTLIIVGGIGKGEVGAEIPSKDKLSQDRNQAIHWAIERGVGNLASIQRDSGTFPAYSCSGPDLQQCRLEHAPSFDTFILYALRSVKDRRVPVIADKALKALEAEMEGQGWWRFWARGDPEHHECGPDLDDTACASAVLLSYGRKPPENVDDLLRYRDATGAFFTWQDPALFSKTIRTLVDKLKVARNIPRVDANDLDCAVNADILLYLTLRGRQSPDACAYVNERIRARDVPRCSLYYPSPMHVFYLVTRAYQAGATCLAPSVATIRPWLLELQRPDGSWGDDLETACAGAALLQMGEQSEAVDRGVAAIVARQQADGSWRRSRFIELYHSSEALATAISLEALGRYVSQESA